MDPVLLIGLRKQQEQAWEVEEHLDELQMLAYNIDLNGNFRLIQQRDKPHNATFVGSGMVEKIQQYVVNESLKAVIFDDELSPAQQRNLEKALSVPVYDRPFVILSIFSERAKTKEAKTQVELARMKYEYPRLKKMWTHLHRQAGHIGGRGGEGEKQLEIDRRMARKKMGRLEKELKRFETRRKTRKKQRKNLLNIALVGYTNAGKSSLMNQLTKAHVEADDRLFVTLDATSRIWNVDPILKTVLSDTVGFIRKLPHNLVASFKSTLTEVSDADLLFHVIDASHPHLEELRETVDGVIESLIDEHIPTVLIFNKIDKLSDFDLKSLKRVFPDGLFVSATMKTGTEKLREYVLNHFAEKIETRTFLLPARALGRFYHINDFGQVLHTHHENEGMFLELRALKERFPALMREIPDLIEIDPADYRAKINEAN
ncbi:MAG: GTPase HflX [Acidobacteria bacterium]|nr:MAG: GTPase HflX [Acidobacteriota bacterium]